MAIKRPDIYEHNNPNLPIVASKDVMGGALFTADLTTLLTDFVGKEAKLLNGVTKVYVISEGVDYRLLDKLAVGVIGSWEVVAGGGGDVTVAGDNVFTGLNEFTDETHTSGGLYTDGSDLDLGGATVRDIANGVNPNDAVNKQQLDTKLDASAYNQHYRGKFISKVALDTNVFTPALISGDYAQVDEGVGEDVVNYNWDADDSVWIVGGSGSGATDTDGLPEGSTNLYYTNARTIGALLTGYVKAGTARALTATDSILTAIGILEKKSDDNATTLSGKLTGTLATDGEVSTQTTPTEDNKYVSRRGLIFHFNWLKTQVVNITSTWSFTKGLFGTTTAKNAHVAIAASTSTLANEHIDWGAAYAGSEAGAEWKETTGYRKYLKRNAITDEYVFMGANPALAGTGTAIMIVATDGSITRGAAIDEEYTLDSDIITAITGATYTAGYATITPSGSKTFRQGESYFDSTTKYKYEAVADNAVIRVIPS